MFEFHYCVSLDIVHPSADPKSISARITGFRITNESMAGAERRTRDGTIIHRCRKAKLTHWAAELHDEKRLFSGTLELSEFIRQKLSELQEYRDLFLELGEEGEVVLRIGWFSDTSHSAELLDTEILRRCGEAGLGIELNFYAPD